MVKKSPKNQIVPKNKKVDFYPNKMTFAIAVCAVTSLMLIAIVIVYL